MHVNKVTNRDLANELGVTEQYVCMLLSSRSKSEKGRKKLEDAFETVMQKRKEQS